MGEEIEERRGEDTLNDEEGYKISRIPQYLIRPMVRSKVLSPHCNSSSLSWLLLLLISLSSAGLLVPPFCLLLRLDFVMMISYKYENDI